MDSILAYKITKMVSVIFVIINVKHVLVLIILIVKKKIINK